MYSVFTFIVASDRVWNVLCSIAGNQGCQNDCQPERANPDSVDADNPIGHELRAVAHDNSWIASKVVKERNAVSNDERHAIGILAWSDNQPALARASVGFARCDLNRTRAFDSNAHDTTPIVLCPTCVLNRGGGIEIYGALAKQAVFRGNTLRPIALWWKLYLVCDH